MIRTPHNPPTPRAGRPPATLAFPGQGRGLIRVLHVRAWPGWAGDAERLILRGSHYLPAVGAQAEALFLLDAQAAAEPLLAQAHASDMPVHLAVERSAVDAAGASALARLVRGGGFDIVHTHDYKSHTLARLFTAVGNYRIVASAYAPPGPPGGRGILEQALLRRADAVLCPSPPLAELLVEAGLSRRRVTVSPNGIDLAEWPFRPRSPHGGPTRLLYVGHLSPERNPGVLLEAQRSLLDRGRAVELALAGEGPLREALTARAAELGLAGQVELLGQRDDVGRWMAWADMLAQPGRSPVLPDALLEALASGLPVIATDAAGLIVHEHTGLLVPPDCAEALADAVARLASQPDVAQALAVRGRAAVGPFDLPTRMAHLVAVYRGVLAAARRCA